MIVLPMRHGASNMREVSVCTGYGCTRGTFDVGIGQFSSAKLGSLAD